MGGLMSVTGLPGQGPVRVGIPICDLSAGMILAQGILIALLDREETGEGQWVHTSLLEAMIQMMDFQSARYLVHGEVAKQAGNDHPTGIPTGVFPAADGHINIAAAGRVHFERLCKALGAQELVDDPDFASGDLRSDNRKALNERIGAYTKERPGAEWIDTFNEAGVPCGPIFTVDQVFADPQVEHLQMARPIDHPSLGEIRLVGQAINLSRTPEPQRFRRPTPGLGEHTDEILSELGCDAERVASLRAKEVV